MDTGVVVGDHHNLTQDPGADAVNDTFQAFLVDNAGLDEVDNAAIRSKYWIQEEGRVLSKFQELHLQFVEDDKDE